MITIEEGVLTGIVEATQSVFTDGLGAFAFLISIPVTFYVLRRVAQMFPGSKGSN